MSSNYDFNEKDARRFWDVIGPSADEWVELRFIREPKTGAEDDSKPRSVNNVEEFIKLAYWWNGKRHVYVGANPRKTKLGRNAESVSRITLIPFDIDAEHPKDDAATVEELRGAESKKDKLVQFLGERGFSTLYEDFSGNGYHVAIRVNLPNTPETAEAITRLYEDAVSAVGKLDNITDPPRILKLPGTWSLKGHNEPERPHRQSYIIQEGALSTNFSIPEARVNTVKPSESKPLPKVDTPETPQLPALVIRLRPCSRHAVEQGPTLSTIKKYKHETALRMSLVEEAYSVGIMKEEQVITLFQHLENYNEEKTRYEVKRKLRAIERDGAHPYGCEAIQNHGGCLGPDCQLYGANTLTHNKKTENDTLPQPGGNISPLRHPPSQVAGFLIDERENSTPTPGTCVKISFEDVDEALNVTIKHDKANKRALFYGFLPNYTNDDQLNFMPVGPTTTGKTYLVSEILSLFPEEDIITLGHASPKAFYHQGGYYESLDGQPVDYLEDYVSKGMAPWFKDNKKPGKGGGVKEWGEALRAAKSKLKTEWIKIPKTKIQNFHQKFLFFLDMPNVQLLEDLRPFLSHDKKRITSLITNKLSSGRNATESITLLGYPTIIFSTTQFALDKQEQTRLVQLSPEISPAKFSDSITLISKKLKNRDAYRAEVDANEKRNKLKDLIKAIKYAGIQQIIIPDDVMAEIEARFRKERPKNVIIAEDQREYPRLIAYVKASTIFNFSERTKTDDGVLFAKLEDVDAGFEIYGPFLLSNESGMPPAIYQFWMDSLSPALKYQKYLKRQEVSQLYFELFKSNIGEKALKHLLLLLLNAGLIVEDVHPEHGSVKVITTRDVDMEALRDAAEESKREKRRMEREDDQNQREAGSHYKHRKLGGASS